MTTLANCEAQTLLHGDGVNELAGNRHVIAGHGHLDLGTIRIGELLDVTRDVGGAEEELWAIAGEERGVTPTLLLSQDVDLAVKSLCGGTEPGLQRT